MSPITGSPNRGYGDWQRTSNWDTPTLYQDTSFVTNTDINAGPFDVSRFAYIAGSDTVLTNPVEVSMSYFAAIGDLLPCGKTVFVLHPSIGATAQYRLENLGSFVTIQWHIMAIGNITHTSRIFATNRFHPLEFIPSGSWIIDRTAVAIGAATTSFITPDEYYAGPMRILCTSAAGGVTFAMQTFNLLGTWDQSSLAITPAAGVTAEIVTLAPRGAWRMSVANPGGATNFGIFAQFSDTGST